MICLYGYCTLNGGGILPRISRRKFMKKSFICFCVLLLVFCLIIPAAFAGQAGTVPALELPELQTGSIIPIPIKETPSNGPRESCYLYSPEDSDPTGYADPSITVNIGRGRIYETNYVYARVKIADPSQIRTALSAPFGSKNTTAGANIARHENAVFAINGDYFSEQNKGAVIRQGAESRMRCDGGCDVLIIDDMGDLTILPNATNDDVRDFPGTVVNALTFGPGLIINGEARYGFRSNAIATHKSAQRMCIAQTGELEYLLVTSEGPEDPGSTGLTLDQWIELIESFGNVQNAYNLDGGSSATMVFRKGDKNWAKINSPNNRKVRSIRDIIYFADAWSDE